MIRVIQRRLIIPRGDTGIFTIPAMTQAEGAIGVFTIFDPITNTRIFQKQVEIEGENFNISFSHADTVNLKAGEYLWDIKFYKNPILADNKVIDGEEINSYYAAFQAPKCEIRETGDDFLMIEGQPAKIEDLNIILAATEAANAAKVAATEKAEEAAARLAEMVAAIPTKVSELENDSGYLQEETDPTVPAWAKAAEKPTYTAQEVGALPDNTFIPSKTSDLTNDSNYAVDANYVHTDNNYTTAEKNKLGGIASGAEVNVNADWNAVNGDAFILNKPTKVSDFQNDTGFITSAALPTKVSDLVDDSGHYTKPVTGIPASDLEETYLTQHQDISMKANSADLAAVATSGAYSDLSGTPTNVSTFTNDAGYLTEHQDISGKANAADLAAVATSGSYEDLSDKPTIPEVPVQDVQINGSSILENNIASIPLANIINLGLVKSGSGEGISIDASGVLKIATPSTSELKALSSKKTIVLNAAHRAVFYALAKAAGADEKDSELPAGQYTDGAKTAIQQMLGVPSTAAIPTLVSQLTNDSGYLTSFTETDPTVPSWAKAAQKPTYTAAEVGAPTVQEMNTAIGNAIGNINSFNMAVVQELPTQDISTHTIYLVPKTGETNDVYDEYVYINSAWEMVGNTQVDLSNYVQKTDYATNDVAGVVKVANGTGIGLNEQNQLAISAARKSEIQAGTNTTKPLVSASTGTISFYGLAKAAGDTTQSQSNNAVGTYTNEAKAAIRSMIGAAASSDIPEVPVQDVQVNGTSVLDAQGIAKVPFIAKDATDFNIKAGSGTSIYVPTGRQHSSVFYGLAKAAGADLANEANITVGTYTTTAQTAIKAMLGVEEGLKVVRLI